jgi:hypothetical protein
VIVSVGSTTQRIAHLEQLPEAGDVVIEGYQFAVGAIRRAGEAAGELRVIKFRIIRWHDDEHPRFALAYINDPLSERSIERDSSAVSSVQPLSEIPQKDLDRLAL